MGCFHPDRGLQYRPAGEELLLRGVPARRTMFLGFLAPDREWLGFVEKVTGGVYGGENVEPLNPDAFIREQADRRAALGARFT